MRRPVAVLLGACALAAIVLLLVVATTSERRAFTLGVEATGPALTLAPNDEVCQQPVAIPDGDAAFDRVAFTLGSVDQPGSPVDVTLKAADGGTIASGRVAGGYPSSGPTNERVSVGHVTTRSPMRVCLRNAGSAKIAVYGNGDLASRTSTAYLNGKQLGVDIGLSFERAEPRSALSLLPAFFVRASLWRADWIGGWVYWLLGAVVLLAVPALMAVALRSALE
jgi:hypothetical protein